MRPWAVVDTNLLLLLVVGRADPAFIEHHKRLRDEFTRVDYARLEALLALSAGVLVTPHVLAETSNLARYIAAPSRQSVVATFARMVGSSREIWIGSSIAAARMEYSNLGLTDAGLIELCNQQTADVPLVLFTIDRPLAYAVQSLGYDAIHFRDL